MISWGMASPLSDLAIQSISPFLLALVQSLVGTVFIGAILVAKRRRPQIPWKLAIALGVAEPGLTFLFGNFGYSHGTVSVGVIILSLETIFAVLIAALWLKEKLRLREAIAILIGIGGAILGADPFTHTGKTDAIGILSFTMAALMAALYVTMVRKYGKEYLPVDLAFGQMLASSALTAISLLFISTHARSLNHPIHFWIVGCLSGLFGVGIPFIAFAIAAKRITATHLAIGLNLIPVAAMIGSFLLGLGAPGPLQITGVALLILSLGVLARNL